MAFTDTIKEIPFAPQTATGKGFLPPILRSSNHILFLVSCLNDKDVNVTEAEALEELRHAQEHWNAREATKAISTKAADRLNLIGKALTEAITEFPKWDEKTRTTNLQDLGHRITQLSTDLDRELIGLRDSDPGRTL